MRANLHWRSDMASRWGGANPLAPSVQAWNFTCYEARFHCWHALDMAFPGFRNPSNHIHWHVLVPLAGKNEGPGGSCQISAGRSRLLRIIKGGAGVL